MSEPEVVRDRDALRKRLRPDKRVGRTIGLVPTMGYLHEGHLSLLRAARQRCDLVVMSLFVNPAQFGPNEDLAAYPRDEERDLRLAGAEGVDFVYAPDVQHVYPEAFATTVEVGGGLTDVLCGDPAGRGPGHFRGVTTVVAKLLNTVDPDVAYFGQKDAQQAIVIRRMARDLDFPVEIVVCPTVREADGLALSSRNAYLTPDQRAQALALHRGLLAAQRARDAGADIREAVAAARAVLDEAGIIPEYLEARDAETLADVADNADTADVADVADLTRSERSVHTSQGSGDRVLVAVAAWVGRARLIDNVVLE